MAVRGPHHGDVGADALEPDDAVHRIPLDLGLALELHAELGEERLGGLDVLDDDEDVVHPLKGHKRRTGIEPASSAWKAEALPLSYRRASA